MRTPLEQTSLLVLQMTWTRASGLPWSLRFGLLVVAGDGGASSLRLAFVFMFRASQPVVVAVSESESESKREAAAAAPSKCLRRASRLSAETKLLPLPIWLRA